MYINKHVGSHDKFNTYHAGNLPVKKTIYIYIYCCTIWTRFWNVTSTLMLQQCAFWCLSRNGLDNVLVDQVGELIKIVHTRPCFGAKKISHLEKHNFGNYFWAVGIHQKFVYIYMNKSWRTKKSYIHIYSLDSVAWLPKLSEPLHQQDCSEMVRTQLLHPKRCPTHQGPVPRSL